MLKKLNFNSVLFKLSFRLSAYLKPRTEGKIFDHRCSITGAGDSLVRSRNVDLSYENMCYIGSRPPYWEFSLREIEICDFFVVELNDAEILGTGVVVDKGGHILLESTIFRTKYLHVLRQNHLLCFRRLLPAVKLKKVIPLSNALQENYYHWIMEGIGRLVMLKLTGQLLGDEQLLIMKNPPDFLVDSICFFFPEYREKIIKSPKIRVKAKTVKLASFPYTNSGKTDFTDIYIPEVIKTINAYTHAKKHENLPKKPVNLFISRRNSRDRKILNEEFLLSELASYNLQVVTLEDLSFEQQVELFFHADVIIATHGAGLTNLLFSNRPSVVVELFPHNRDIRDIFCFGLIANILKINYVIIEYNASNDNYQNLEVDDEIIMNIKRSLNSRIYN